MSTKALKRELAAAIAMLLVAMIALSGSTYAWFASNNKVQAEDMTITAMSDAAFLEITVADKAFTGSQTQIAAKVSEPTTTDSALYPVTPFKPHATEKHVTTDLNVSGGSLVWSYTYSDSVSAAAMGADQLWKTVGAANSHTMEESVLENTFYFRMSVEGVKGLNLIADATNMTATFAENLDKGACVLLAGPNGYQLIKSDKTSTMYNTDGEVDPAAKLINEVTYVEKDQQTTAKTVVAYVFYDGENTNVFTNNLTDTVEANIAVLPFKVD